MFRVRIASSDGLDYKVLNADTGERIEGIQMLTIYAEVGGPTIATLVLKANVVMLDVTSNETLASMVTDNGPSDRD